MKKRLVLGAALPLAAGIGLAAQASLAATHGHALHLTKECSAYRGRADQHCTITASNVKAIPVGSRVVYLEAKDGTSLASDIVVVVGRGQYALGHVRVNLATGVGRVTLTGGAGRLRGFHARAAISPLGGADFAWDGTYRSDDGR